MAKKEISHSFLDPSQFKPGEEIPLPDHILCALRCYDKSKVKFRNWRPLPIAQLTKAEKAMLLIESKFVIPGGNMVGKPAKLMLFQEVIIYLLIDCEPRTAMVSMARRNGKTFIQACLVLLHLVGFLSERNMSIGSFALGREQAGILFKQLADMIALSPDIAPLCKIIPSSKRVVGLRTGAEYFAGSGEAKTNLGRSFKYIVLDEAGSIKGPDNEYTQALRTSQASYETATFVAISTAAATDADYFSVMLDSAEMHQPKDTVSIVFETPKEFDLTDETGWIYSNPGIGVFRSYDDMKAQAEAAKRLPAQESGFRNLSLNQRVAMTQLAFSPSLWKQGAGDIDLEVFRNGRVVAGCDLSSKNDLTAIVLCAEDADQVVHVLPFVFCPTDDIELRSRRDKAPYDVWCKTGKMIPVGGRTMDFDQIAGSLKSELDKHGIFVDEIFYDKHMMSFFKSSCERQGALSGATWTGVPQYFREMGVRLASLQGMMIQDRIRHGDHPLLTMAASNAIAVTGREGLSALDKAKSTLRIDPLVALVMGAWIFGDGRESQVWDVSTMIA